ncbi:hypothetical protein KASIA_p144 [Shewanella phage vB_SspS_KASIA]|nr:hypothetical protein KASIA_p144 [Shewanella phage vB_SspS_KASIA]
MIFELSLEEGKYTVLYDNGYIEILRNGAHWRNETGDGFINSLLISHTELEQKLHEKNLQVNRLSKHPLILDHLEDALNTNNKLLEIIRVLRYEGEYFGGMNSSSWVQQQLSLMGKQ